MPNDHLEKNLWDAADELCANSKLRAADYSIPVLGLIFLKYADHKFAHATGQLKAQAQTTTSRRRRQRDPLSPDRYKAAGVLYLPNEAHFKRLVKLPEGENIGRKINDAMKAIEKHNETLKDVLPKTYIRFENATLREIEAQGWSLNPGRYVGVPERDEDDDFDFATALTALHEELEILNAEAHELEERIAGNVTQLLDSLQ